MKIFVSHIHEEAALAQVLKEWIESSFAGQCEVFVSSDRDDIPPGAKWLDRIDQALSSAGALIVLCSPNSLSRPWINFETGCGWIKRVPVIPVCHSGQAKADLPPPMSLFQALELQSANFVEALLAGLATHLRIAKIPRVDHSAMRSELLAAGGRAAPGDAGAPVSSQPTGAVPPEVVQVLARIASSSEQPDVRELASALNVPGERMKYYLDILQEKKLVHYSLYMGRPATYYVTKEGRRFLVSAGLL